MKDQDKRVYDELVFQLRTLTLYSGESIENYVTKYNSIVHRLNSMLKDDVFFTFTPISIIDKTQSDITNKT